jgi:minor extracellular serine protease Vpr
MLQRITILLASVFLFAMTYEQNIKNEEKIDPALRALIASQKDKLFSEHKKSTIKLRSKLSRQKISTNADESEKYECTVYTADAKSLVNKGIVVNSTLPTFATVIVTGREIEMMASMDQVIYIEAAKTLDRTQRNVNATPSELI